MCGIVSIVRFDGKPARKMVERRYGHQKSRGQSGFGFLAVNDTGIVEVNRTQTEKEIMALLDKTTTSKMILFHHRTPTSTPNYVECAHPIKVSHSSLQFDYYVAHNGVISNDLTVKESHNRLGIEYSTEMGECHISRDNKVYPCSSIWNDSEALATDLALFIEGKKSYIEARGSIAFVLYQVQKENNAIVKMFYGRNTGNPLQVYENKDFMSLCSESAGDPVKPDTLFWYDPYTNARGESPVAFSPSYVYSPPPVNKDTGYKNLPASRFDDDDDYYDSMLLALKAKDKAEPLMDEFEVARLEDEWFNLNEEIEGMRVKLKTAKDAGRPEVEILALESKINVAEDELERINDLIDKDAFLKDFNGTAR